MKKELTVSLVVMLAVALAFVACGDGGGGGGGGGGGDGVRTVALVNGQAADVVIGQPDMYSGDINQGGSVSEHTIYWPWGNPAVVGSRLYVPDFGNNRVLGFNSIPAINNAPADFVLGQPDFTSTASGLSQSHLYSPENVFSDNGKLFLVDASNSRVLVWNTIPTITNTPPDVVVGQPDFDTEAGTCDDSTLASVEGAYAVSGKLIVSDRSHHRVLIWNTVPTTNGTPADVVLGQVDFTGCDVNRGGSVSQNSMNSPQGAWSDGKKLIIADSNNYRVLIWNTFPMISNTPPDVVVGQADFTSTANDITQDRFSWPVDLSSNGKQLFVADASNNRVMVWNTIPAINNAPADLVLGQADFTSNTGGIGPDIMNSPGGVLVHGNQVFVGEWDNNRYLIFNGQ